MVLGDCCSSTWPLTYELSQGSIFSPVLLNVKVLGKLIRRSGLKCHQYNDDLRLYLSIPSDHKAAVENVNLGLEPVMGLKGTNKLRLSPDKDVDAVRGVLLIQSLEVVVDQC